MNRQARMSQKAWRKARRLSRCQANCEDACARSTAVVQERADARAADLAPTIKALQASGAVSLRAIAAALNARGIPTSHGAGEWSAVQVARILKRI